MSKCRTRAEKLPTQGERAYFDTVTPTAPAPPRARRASTNRRHRVPLCERLPDRAGVTRVARQALLASLPSLLTLAILAAVAGGLWFGYRWLTASQRFALADIEVRGTSAMQDDDVRRLLAPAMGENLFRLPLGALEQRLRREPWVASAAVRRRLPDGLVVELVEHRAAVVVELGGLYLADADGNVFKRVDLTRGEGAGLPVVTGISRDDYRRAPDQARARIRGALEVAAVWAVAGDRPPVGEIHEGGDRGVTLYTSQPVRALRLGRSKNRIELRRRMTAFDTAWGALSPGERTRATTFHLDRDGWPLRVAVGFQRGTTQWPK